MIIRRRHTRDYATIGNVLFDDVRLQADEVGIIAYLLSRPHDWEVRRPQLAKRFGYGREAIKRVIWNGMRFGWIVAERRQLADGRFVCIYEVRDEPGPVLSEIEIRRALSLGSSEVREFDEDEPAAGRKPETGDPPEPPPATGQPATGDPGAAEPATGNPYVDSKEESTKYGFTKDSHTKRARVFAQVQREWPTDNVLSAITAEAAFVMLTDADQADCDAGMKPYLADCRAQNRKVCDLTTFIRERRWQRFVGKEVGRKEMWTHEPHSAQWYRWREYKIAKGEPIAFMEAQAKLGKGITTHTEWPPAIARSA